MRVFFIIALMCTGCIEPEDNNPFGEGLLQGEPSFTHGVEPWPEVSKDEWLQPEPRRVFYVATNGDDSAFGGSEEPWASLQTSLCKLRPGDRLVIRKGTYSGPIYIDDDCTDVPPGQFIDVVGESGTKLVGAPALVDKGFWEPVLLINRSGWTVRGLQIDAAPRAGVGVQVAAGGGNTTLRDLVIYGSGSAGLTIGPRADDVSAHNLVIRNGFATDGVSHGVVVFGGCSRLALTENFIRNNTGDGVHLLGSHVVPSELSFIENLAPSASIRIEGNRIHDNRGHGVVVGHTTDVEVKANVIWNVRPSPNGQGVAIELHDGAEEAVVERNLIAEATEGVVVAAGNRPEANTGDARAPEGILVERNVVFNRINSSRFGLVVDQAVSVRLYHNLVYNSRKALMTRDLPPKTQSIRVLNNLFLEALELGFRTSGMSVFERFESNAFGLSSGAVQSEVGDQRQAIAAQVDDGTLDKTFVVNATSFTDGDLSRPNGIEVIDQGTSIPGFSFEGTAPDLGPVERSAAD